MKEILILVFSNLKNDARVIRQVKWASHHGHLTVACFDAEEDASVNIVRISQTVLTPWRKLMLGAALLVRWYSLAYRLFHGYGDLVRMLKDKKFDLVIANDIDTLPLAFEIAPQAKIVFDAHEYAPRHFENRTYWRLLFQPFYIALCKKYIPKIKAMLTVGEGLAAEYEKNFGVRPTIITNATRYFDLRPSTTSANSIRLVHHGIVNKSRQLELMIDMIELLDERFTLDMYLLTSDYASGQTKSYLDALKARVANNPRVRILPAIKSSEVVMTLNGYDLGVFLIPPINFNYANTLPNKLFDFIQARLGIAIGPTPEMRSIVNQFGNGIVSENFTAASLAAKLRSITTDDILRFKTNSDRAASELNAEKNEKIFSQILKNLIQ